MADILKDSFLESKQHTKVIFQRGRDVLDFELNELQDCIRVMTSRVGAMFGNGAFVVGDLRCVGDNVTANLLITATSPAGFLVDGQPVRLDANTTLAIPAAAGTYKVYAIVSEIEVDDPTPQAELGVTSRRRKYTITFAQTLGAIPTGTGKLWAGGTQYAYLADVIRAGTAPIPPGNVTDKRSLVPAYFIVQAMQAGVATQTITGNQAITGGLTVAGTLTAGSLSLTNLSLSGTLAVTGIATFSDDVRMSNSKKINWTINSVDLYSDGNGVFNIDLGGAGEFQFTNAAGVHTLQAEGNGGVMSKFGSSEHPSYDPAGYGFLGSALDQDFMFLMNNVAVWKLARTTGNIESVGGNKQIKGVTDPSSAQDAATRNYVDTTTVRLTGTQSIAGIKSFVNRLTVINQPGVGAANLRLENLDSVASSNALFATSVSVGATADFRNTSTGPAVSAIVSTASSNAAVRAVHADGYAVECIAKTVSPVKSPLRITPQDNPPSTGAMGDLYVDSTTGKLYIYTTSWILVGSQV